MLGAVSSILDNINQILKISYIKMHLTHEQRMNAIDIYFSLTSNSSSMKQRTSQIIPQKELLKYYFNMLKN